MYACKWILALCSHLPPHWCMVASCARVERIALFLAGTAHDADKESISAYFRRCTGFSPVSVLLQPQRVTKVVLEGAGAIAAASRVEGKHTEDDRAFEQCHLDLRWFCPCGRSGSEPLGYAHACAECGARRPKDIAEAATAVPSSRAPSPITATRSDPSGRAVPVGTLHAAPE